MSAIIRSARAGEENVLTAIVRRSKASWGYDAAFMDRYRAELTVTAAHINDGHLLVAVVDTVLAGMVRWESAPPIAELTDLWVDPPFLGHGLGRLLLETAADSAQLEGISHFAFDADPHAEAFYLHLGAIRVGDTISERTPGRILPRMELNLPL